MKPLPEIERYTYEDYYAWDDGKRYELIDGAVRLMSPAPAPKHQAVQGGIFSQLDTFLNGRRCAVFQAPFDVRLNPDGADDTVVQPDILVVCDLSKIDKRGLKGAPDMIVEITSPSTASYDRVTKFNKYLEAGVLEYWIVDPDSKSVAACVLKDGNYIIKAYGESDEAPVSVLEGCVIKLSQAFDRARLFFFED